MEDLTLLLNEILSEKQAGKREKLIENFQNSIWIKDEVNENDPLYEIYNELAYDLEFYDPNPKYGEENFSSYGDERLEREIREALRKIHNVKNDQ